MQQACCAGAESASASGAIVPTSNSVSRTLAVRRCIGIRASPIAIRWLTEYPQSPRTRKAASLHQHITTAVREEYEQVYQYEDQIVVPARSFLAPEASVPREYLQIDSAQHYYHQAQRRELREHSESYTQPSGNFRDSKKNGKTLAHPDTLGTLCGFRNVTPA